MWVNRRLFTYIHAYYALFVARRYDTKGQTDCNATWLMIANFDCLDSRLMLAR